MIKREDIPTNMTTSSPYVYYAKKSYRDLVRENKEMDMNDRRGKLVGLQYPYCLYNDIDYL